MLFRISVALSALLVLSLSSPLENAIQKYVNVCHRSNPKLAQCIKSSIENLRPRLANGIEEIGIPPCEPLEISEIKLEEKTGAIVLYSSYKDILINGLSNFNIRDVKIDIGKNRYQMKLWFPSLEMTANYTISGKIMMMMLQGEGACSGNFTDIDVTTSITTDRVVKNGQEYLTLKDIGVKFNIGGSSVNLENLFNGDRELGPALNKFLNENWQSIIGEIRPTLEKTMGEMLKTIAAKLFEQFTYNQLLPP